MHTISIMRSLAVAALIVVLGLAIAGALIGWRVRTAPPGPPALVLDELDPLVARQLTVLLDQVDEHRRDPQIRAQLAMSLHANNVYDHAEDAYLHALQLNPDDPRLWYHLASVRAERYGREAGIEQLEQAIELEPSYAPARCRYGFWLLELGRLEAARDQFQLAVELEPLSVAPRVGLARIALQERQTPLAAQTLEGLVRERPQVPYLQYLLGTAYRQMGRQDDARPLLAMASGSAPQWEDPWARRLDDLQVGYEATLTRAQNLLLVGQPDRALDLMLPMLQLQPSNPELLCTVGSAHIAAGRRSEGLRLLQKSARDHPRHYQTRLSLSQAYADGDDLEAAFREAQRSIELNPAFGPAHRQLGRLHVRMGRMEPAATSLRNAVRYGADDANTRLLLGAVLERLALWTEANDVYERLYQRAPTSKAALGLARSRSATGDLTGAWALIEEVRLREPSEPDLKPTIDHLRQQQGRRP